MIKNRKLTIKPFLPWAVLIVMLGWMSVTGSLKDVVMALSSIKPLFLVLSLLLIVAYWLSETSILLLLLNHKVSFRRALTITLAGQFFNGITPFASGGQPAQLYLLHKDNVALGKGASVLTKKFIAYQAALVVYGLVVLIFEANFFKDQIAHFVYLGILGFIVNLSVILFLLLIAFKPKFIKKWILSISRFLRKKLSYKRVTHNSVQLLKHINAFNAHMKDVRHEKNALAISFAVSLIQLTLFFMIPVTIGLGFQLTFSSLLYVIGASAFVAMVTAFIPFPGAAGGAEGSFFIVFRIFFPANLILTTLLLWRVITYYLPVAVGGMVVAMDGTN